MEKINQIHEQNIHKESITEKQIRDQFRLLFPNQQYDFLFKQAKSIEKNKIEISGKEGTITILPGGKWITITVRKWDISNSFTLAKIPETIKNPKVYETWKISIKVLSNEDEINYALSEPGEILSKDELWTSREANWWDMENAYNVIMNMVKQSQKTNDDRIKEVFKNMN